MLEFKFS